jgi:hypothetical protein
MNEKIRNFFIVTYSKDWLFSCIVSGPLIICMILSLFLVYNQILLVLPVRLALIAGPVISALLFFCTEKYHRYAIDFKKIESNLTEMEDVLQYSPVRVSELVEGLLTGSTFGYEWTRVFGDKIYFKRYGSRFAKLLVKVNERFSELDDSHRLSLYKALLSKYQEIGNGPDAVGEWVNLLRDAVESTKVLMQARRREIRDEITGPLTLNDYFAKRLFDFDNIICESQEVESNIRELMRDTKGGVPYELLAFFWKTNNKEMLFRFGRFSHEIRTIPRESISHPVQ